MPKKGRKFYTICVAPTPTLNLFAERGERTPLLRATESTTVPGRGYWTTGIPEAHPVERTMDEMRQVVPLLYERRDRKSHLFVLASEFAKAFDRTAAEEEKEE